MARQFSAVLWRTLVVQCLRRHYIDSFMELIVVLLLALVFLSSEIPARTAQGQAGALTDPQKEYNDGPDHDGGVEDYPKPTDNPEMDSKMALFSPYSAYSHHLMSRAYPHYTLATAKNETVLIDSCERDIASFVVCVHFGAGKPASSDPGKVPVMTYTLHLFEGDNPGESGLGIGFRAPKGFNYDPDTDMQVWASAHDAQRLINLAHISLQGHTPSASNNITVRQFPLPHFPENIDKYRGKVFWFLFIAFVFPAWKLLSRLITENMSGMREHQIMMGLSNCAYWTGHFSCSLCFCLVHSAVCAYFATSRPQSGDQYVFLDRTDPTLVYVVFAWHSVQVLLMAMLIACIFTNVLPALMWLMIVAGVLPYWLNSVLGGAGTLAEFLFRDRRSMLASSAFPTLATYNVLIIVGIQNDFHGGATWKSVADVSLGVLSVTVLDIWLVNLGTVVVTCLLIFYFSKVLPWNTSHPEHPLFVFKPSCWYPPKVPLIPPTMELRFKDERFEPAPKDVFPVLHVEDLTVSYGGHEALKCISFQAFQNQVTVLVGRNGAGKTTLMNVIAGLVKPSSGKVYVYGYDVVKYASIVHSVMTYCPQRDMLFSDLTVWEHLIYFGTLKQLEPKDLRAAAEEALVLANLEKSGNRLVEDLRRGSLKRLGIAVGFLAKPKVVLIDEATSGLDQRNTRIIWDILLQSRGKNTVILTTHNMTEADVFAHRVVGLSAGTIVCNASPHYLKKIYGSGYTIDMRKLPGASFRANHVLSIVRKYANNAQLLSDGQETATVALHTAVPKGFKDMFRELERNRAYIGIRDIRLHVSTLKDIYLRLTLARVSLSKSPHETRAKPEDIETLIRSKGEGPSRWAQISVLSTERCIFLRRHWVPTIIGWLVPLLILVVSFEWMGVGGYSRKPLPAAVFPVPVSLKQLYPQAKTFLDDDPAATEGIGSYYQKLMDQEGAAVDLYHNSTVMGMLQQDAAENFLAYASHYVLGADFNGGEFVAWYNPYAILSKVLAFDIVSSALLGFRAENASMRFRTTLAIHVPELSPAEGRSWWKLVGDKALSSGLQEDIMALVNERAHDLAHIWVLLAPLAMSVTMAAFVPYASAESRSGFMQLQLMTGVPGWLHCLVNLLFDAVMFIWLAVPVAILFVSFFKLNAASYGAIALVFVQFGLLAILSAYVIAYSTSTIEAACATTLILYSVLGTVTLKVLLYLLKDGTNLSLLCTALPPCAVPMVVIKVMVLEWVHDTCDLLAATVIDKDNRTALRAFCLEAANFLEIYQQNQYSGLTGLPVEKCCATLDESYTENWSPFQLHLAAAGLDICFLLAELALLFTYLSWRNSGYFLCSDKVGTLGEQLWTDTEVDMEKRKVDCVCDERKAGKEGRWCERFALVLEEVHKWYGDWYALCGLNLALAKNECFGLLGVHGSGKTTVVEILAGVTRLSLGEGYMGELRLSGSPRAWQSQLGYCPQADALMNSFTGLEILEFFARLRGVPGESILPLVEAIASISELGETIFDSCETYSSGMRRKLSTMVALIGIPQLVLLDDPTTGMDMIGRQMIYQTLREITEAQASAVILTSRSTEECQQACSRVGLMIGGDLRGLGDMDRLRRRFSTGMTITFRLNETISHYTAKLVKRAVERLFPKAQQMDLRQGFFLFYIEYRLPWSHVFSRLEKLRQWFRLEKVLVCESSLDELFLGMARTEMAEDAGEARRMAKEASYADYVGDPWGRQPQELHMHAQHHRATKLHDKEEESLKEHEGVASKSNRSAAEMSPKWVPQD